MFFTFILILHLASLNTVDSLLRNDNTAVASAMLRQLSSDNLSEKDLITYNRLWGDYHRLSADFTNAIMYYNEALVILKDDVYSEEGFKIYYGLSIVSRNLFDFHSCFKNTKQLIIISEKLQDDDLSYKANVIAGNAYYIFDSLTLSQESYYKALKYIADEEIEKKKIVLFNLGAILLKSNKLIEARKIYEDSYHYLSSKNRPYDASIALLSIAETYFIANDCKTVDVLLDKLNEAYVHKNSTLKRKILNLKIDCSILNNPEARMLLDSLDVVEHHLFDEEIRDLNKKYEVDQLESNLEFKAIQSESRKKSLVYLALSGLLIILGLGYVIHTQRIKNKLKLTEEKLEKQQALEKERTRIAGEMHDDIGGGLTTIKFLSQKILKKVEDERQKEQISKILSNAQVLVSNMSEIIWAMNSRFDTVDNLVAYTRRYAMEYFTDYDIKVNFKVDQKDGKKVFTGEDRRNVFLAIKEALNNVTKHAEASEVDITIKVNHVLLVTIHDNGKGLNDSAGLGNGLKNIESRIKALGGKVNFVNENGLKITMEVPFSKDDKSFNLSNQIKAS